MPLTHLRPPLIDTPGGKRRERLAIGHGGARQGPGEEQHRSDVETLDAALASLTPADLGARHENAERDATAEVFSLPPVSLDEVGLRDVARIWKGSGSPRNRRS
jgi:hypothetical protein